MKNLQTKLKSIDLKWLPPAEEWDFRSVTMSECRVACHWEYERENHPIAPSLVVHHKANAAAKNPASMAAQGGATRIYYPTNYRQAARELFPQPWTTLTKEQRQKVMETFFPAPVMQVRKLREFFKRMPMSGASPEILQSLLQHSYVVVPNFTLHGVEAVIKEFEKWARKEAKQHRQSRRAQAAELPFDALKWLAVLRLDQARRKALVTIERARESLSAYQRANPRPDINGVFPTYASDGAWVKARNDARRCQSKSMNNPSFLLAELA
jgi:hypothetical protein